jgi:hypothetical protein
MWQWIARPLVPFIGRRTEGRRKGQHPFQKGKGARGAALGSCMEGRSEDPVAQR